VSSALDADVSMFAQGGYPCERIVQRRDMVRDCDDAPYILSLGAIERVYEVRKTVDGDGTKTGVEVCLALVERQ